MKSERRHELQHNDLAEWIVKGYEGVRPYKNTILGVGLLAIVLLIGMMLWQSHSIAQAGGAWGSMGLPLFQPIFVDERTIGSMQKTIADYPSTSAADWAKVFQGDTALMVGANQLFTDKKRGVEYLTQARKYYEDALPTLTIPAAKEQAMFGKARAIEALIQDQAQLDEALKAYQELNRSFPQGMFKTVAEQRIEQLSKPADHSDVLKFYRALAQYTPKPPAKNSLKDLGPLPEPEPTTPTRGSGSPTSPASVVPAPTSAPIEPAKKDAPKSDAPKTDVPKTDPAKPQAVKPDAPKAESPKPDAPKIELVKPDAPKPNSPKIEPLQPDAPKKDK